MYKFVQDALAQMGAVGLLLAFSGIVVYWFRADMKEKDEKLAAKDKALQDEITKREELLREVLESHHDLVVALKTTSEQMASVTSRIEDIVERIESKIDGKA